MRHVCPSVTFIVGDVVRKTIIHYKVLSDTTMNLYAMSKPHKRQWKVLEIMVVGSWY
jgi:hypothetical protein